MRSSLLIRCLLISAVLAPLAMPAISQSGGDISKQVLDGLAAGRDVRELAARAAAERVPQARPPRSQLAADAAGALGDLEEAIAGAGGKATGRLAAAQSRPRDSIRGSAEYRRNLVEVLTKRALLKAIDGGHC